MSIEDELDLVAGDTHAWAEETLPDAAETWTCDYGMTGQFAEVDVTEDDWDRAFAASEPVELEER